ncbi:MAG TPA: glycosyltransferase family 39 protein [Candidatus Woesebacteria bacterium]|nr:glycosyltransferase family 39 protein [Candidatus Woesebacteria bacterium]
MKSFQNFCKQYVFWIVGLFCIFAIILHSIHIQFPYFNSDEASFAYNGYSIAQTGKDEYGSFMPSRFKAFGENKLPVTIYTIAAFVKIFGLSELTARLPFIIIGVISPILFYILSKRLFNNIVIALISAFTASISPWIQIISRHIHEDLIIMLLTIIAVIYLINLLNKFKWQYIIALSLLSGIGLFTYHIGKVLTVYFFFVLLIILAYQKKSWQICLKSIIIFLIPVIIFGFTELQNPTTRVSNLLFINDPGFTASIEELRKEHDERIIHNKLTQSIIVLTQKYLSYFSPEFLVINGDENPRFGFKGISPITPITYILVLTGIYFLFKNNEKYRFFIISLLLIAPITASLSWQEYSLTRSFLLIIPILTLESYGVYHVITKIKWHYIAVFTSIGLLGSYLFFTFYSWDFYYNHYLKKRDTIYAWQGGYKELNTYIKQNYDSTKQFYITKKLGQPYIFTLFYLQFPPHEYQKQAQLTELDEYGFGQVEQFDKFTFSFKPPTDERNIVYMGYPEDFQGSNINKNQIKKITIHNEEIFWIYNIK